MRGLPKRRTDETVFVDTYTVALDRVCLTTLELSTLPSSVPEGPT